jgi:hypothetical protein
MSNLKNFVWFAIGSIGLILIVFVSTKYIGSKQYKPAIPPGSKTEYVIHTEYKDRPIYISRINATIDTIYQTVYDSSHTSTIVAKADTTITEDSTQIKISYYFPPQNYFQIDANIKEKIITKELTITKPYEPKFFDRFNVVIYGGFGYDFLQKVPAASIGLGFGINIKKLF